MDQELYKHVVLKIFYQMNDLNFDQIAPSIMFMLNHTDTVFKSKFRAKLKNMVKNKDIKHLELSYQDWLSILYGLRNFNNDYQVWLKIDNLLYRAMKNEDIQIIPTADDLFHIMNCLALEEIQSLESWQILIQSFIHYIIEDKHIDINRLVNAILWFKHITIKSPELYEMIINYFWYK